MQTKPSFFKKFSVYSDRRALTMLLLGFAAGMPLLLIFSTLSLWLSEAGIEKKTVTMFSWAALGYSFKFVWAPLIDSLPLPYLSRTLGKRRAWLLLAQVLVIVAIIAMGSIDPQNPQQLAAMAMAAVLLGFSAATQDIVIDAYRIEIAPNDHAMQTVMSSTYTVGYRLGLIAAGAGSLLLAEYWGSTKAHYLYDAWRNTYWVMAAMMATGLATTLWMREPEHQKQLAPVKAQHSLRLLALFLVSVSVFVAVFRHVGALLPAADNAPLQAFAWESLRLGASLVAAAGAGCLAVKCRLAPSELVRQTWIAPVADFFHRYGKRAILLLALIGLYRVSDIVAGVISNVFYDNMGFSKEEIAYAVKSFGIVMSIAGGFVGGLLAQKYKIMSMMMLGAIATAATNLLFILLALRGHDVPLMYLAVGIDNLAGGFASTVFVVFLSGLTNIRFTAVQYALLSSLMTLSPKILGGYSGAMASQLGYPAFFLLTALMGVPILLLVYLTNRYIIKPSS